MKLVVCGGRNYDDRAFAYRALDAAHARRAITLLVHGDARGADRIGRDWAASRGIEHKAFPADWKRHRKLAGPFRNQQMVDFGLDGCIAFPGGSGTADMRRRCMAANVPVWEPGVRP